MPKKRECSCCGDCGRMRCIGEKMYAATWSVGNFLGASVGAGESSWNLEALI